MLPAMLWLAVQLAMAAGLTIASPAAAKPPPGLAPLVAGLDSAHWLCGPGSEAGPDQPAPSHETAQHCIWCQGFGALPDLASKPEALPPFATPGLRNQPFASAAPPAATLPVTGFRSRAPPL